MRSRFAWLPALAGLLLTFAPASALPVPKLPPEATDKPSVVVRVRPLGELMKDAAYLAKLVGQEEVFNAFEPGIQPVVDVLDAKKPIGFYAKITTAGVDSLGVLMLPVKNVKDFTAILNQLGVGTQEGQDGLHTVNVAGAPFQVFFRHAHGYIYASVKNSPDAEAYLALNKLYRPEAIFNEGDDSLVSVTFNADALPNDLKRKALENLDKGLAHIRTNDIPREQNPLIRTFLETASEEIGLKIQSLLVDTQTVVLRFDLDRAKEDMAMSFRLTPRKSTDLANDIASVGTSQGLGAGLTTATAIGHFSTYLAVPSSMKKNLDPVIDDVLGQAWKKAQADHQELAKELLDALAPTLKSGILDAGVDLRGPAKDGTAPIVVAIAIKDGPAIEKAIRKIHGVLPANAQAKLKVDFDKAEGVAIHHLQGERNKDLPFLGESPSVLVAFRKDCLLVSAGPQAEALAAIKESLAVTGKASKVIQSRMSIRGLAPLVEAKEAGFSEAAKKAYPAGINDDYRFTVTGGDTLEARFSTSTRIIQFGMLLEQIRRNR